MSMPRRTLGRTGLSVPALGHGTVPIGRAGFDRAEARRLVDALIEAGVDLFDTAAAYDDSEIVLGELLEGRRDDVVLVTKTGMDVGYEPGWGRKNLERLIERSLGRLRTDHVDVLLLHTCDLADLEKGEVLDVLRDAKARGQSRFVGYSGDGDALAHALASDVVDVIETSYSLLDQANRPLIRQAAANGIGVLLKRPLANAVPGRAKPPADSYAAAYWPRWQGLAWTSNDVGGAPWLEAALRFAAYADGVTTALVGSGSLPHMQGHVDAVTKGPLPVEVVTHLERSFDAAAHGRWPGLR